MLIASRSRRWELCMVEDSQFVAKLQVSAVKGRGTVGYPASRLPRDGVCYFDELGNTVDLRGSDHDDIESVGR